MSKKPKMKLDELNVQSFVTSIENNGQNTAELLGGSGATPCGTGIQCAWDTFRGRCPSQQFTCDTGELGSGASECGACHGL